MMEFQTYKIVILGIALLLFIVSVGLLFRKEWLNKICNLYNRQLVLQSKWAFNANDDLVFSHRFSFGVVMILHESCLILRGGL